MQASVPESNNPLPTTPPSLQALMQERMLAHRDRYLQQMADWKQKMEAALSPAGKNELTAENRQELERCAHNLAGTGTTFGFPLVSESGKKLMQHIYYYPDSAAVEVVSLTEDLLAACNAALAKDR